MDIEMQYKNNVELGRGSRQQRGPHAAFCSGPKMWSYATGTETFNTGRATDGIKITQVSNFAFFTARAYARAVLGVVILSLRPSVCPSVRLSHACIVTKLNDALQIFLYHTKRQSLCYSDTKSGWSATPPSLWNLRSKWHTSLPKTATSTDFRS